MKFSASALSTLTQCGYKYELNYIHGMQEPGRKSFNMLLGKVLEDAVQSAALYLNEHKQMTVDQLGQHLYESWKQNLEEAQCKDVDTILSPIFTLLTDGLDPAVCDELDSQMDLLNTCPRYEFKLPKVNKDGTWSKNKTTPTLSMHVTSLYEEMIWFFSAENPYLEKIREARHIEVEKYFQVPVGDPYTTVINGQAVEEQDVVDGYYDLMLHLDGERYIFELKRVSTEYTYDFVQIGIQQLTYHMSCPDTTVVTFDFKARGFHVTEPDEQRMQFHMHRFLMARKMIRDRIFVPACGTNPWATDKMLCGFKEHCQCPYAPGYKPEVENAAADPAGVSTTA